MTYHCRNRDGCDGAVVIRGWRRRGEEVFHFVVAGGHLRRNISRVILAEGFFGI
jgi:hypothetical protein